MFSDNSNGKIVDESYNFLVAQLILQDLMSIVSKCIVLSAVPQIAVSVHNTQGVPHHRDSIPKSVTVA